MKRSELRQIIKEELSSRDRSIYDKFYNQTRSDIVQYIKALRNILGSSHKLTNEARGLLFKLDDIDTFFEKEIGK